MAEPWINKKNWLKGYVEPRKPAEIIEEQIEENKEEKIIPTTVIFIKPKCPKCGNKNLRCYGIDKNIRYFKCKCGHKFKAIEKT